MNGLIRIMFSLATLASVVTPVATDEMLDIASVNVDTIEAVDFVEKDMFSKNAISIVKGVETEETDVEKDTNNVSQKEEKGPKLVNIEVPTYTYTKTYEDGGLITNPTAAAYEWINKCYISNTGHYMYEGCYAVAMGNYFNSVGTKYKITLDNGKTFNVIKCDVKQDKHTTNQMLDASGAMIEFIIDTDTASAYYGVGQNGYILNGSFNNSEEFNGTIIKVEKILEDGDE